MRRQRIALFLRSMSALAAVSMSQSLMNQCCIQCPAPYPPPLPACLPACSATAEGFDATFGKPKDQLLVLERRRPARVVTGEGKLLPLVRDGSTKQVRPLRGAGPGWAGLADRQAGRQLCTVGRGSSWLLLASWPLPR